MLGGLAELSLAAVDILEAERSRTSLLRCLAAGSTAVPQERLCCVKLMETSGFEACILASWQAHEQYACCQQSATPWGWEGHPR